MGHGGVSRARTLDPQLVVLAPQLYALQVIHRKYDESVNE